MENGIKQAEATIKRQQEYIRVTNALILKLLDDPEILELLTIQAAIDRRP